MNDRSSAEVDFYADVTRLIRRHIGGIHHTGIDRVNLEYARWVHEQGGHLCIRRGPRLKKLSREAWGRMLLGARQPGHYKLKHQQRLAFLFRSLLFRKDIPDDSRVTVSTHSWLACGDTWRWAEGKKCKAFVFIHDLIPLQYPEYSHPRERAKHEHRLRNTLSYSSGIIVNSCCTESAVHDYARKNKLLLPPTLVAPLGHDLPRTDRKPISKEIRGPYFVILGTIEPRKNHLLLLTLWRELVRRHGEKTPQLVVVGRRGWECEQVVDLLERCEAIHPYLIEKNNASDEEVAALLSGAQALLMPSYAEGFGMPVQEALALGTPVISSPLPAIREFAADIPDYAATYDGARWLELIESYARTDSPERIAQLQRLPVFCHHTWQEHFRSVEKFLEAI